MKLPKKLKISGKTYTIVYDSKDGGASFEMGKQIISVGSRWTKEITFENLLHEVLEIIYTERGHRFTVSGKTEDNGTRKFMLSHDDFENSCKDLVDVLLQMYSIV